MACEQEKQDFDQAVADANAAGADLQMARTNEATAQAAFDAARNDLDAAQAATTQAENTYNTTLSGMDSAYQAWRACLGQQ